MSVTEVPTTGSLTRADGALGDAGSEDAVAARLRALEGMTYDGLRTEWRRLYRAHPPKRVDLWRPRRSHQAAARRFGEDHGAGR